MTPRTKYVSKKIRNLPQALGAACLTGLLAYAAWSVPTPSAAESRLTGKLYGQSSAGSRYPIPHASLQFCVPSGGCVDTFTGADGSYSVRVNQGANYEVIAPARDGGFVSEKVFIDRGMRQLDILAD